jgi:hypothetical protein
MSQQDEAAVISFPIKLVTDEQTEATSEDEVDQESLDAMEDFIKTTDKQGLQNLSKYAKNPTGAVTSQLMGILGKAGVHGAIAAAIIAMVAGSPEIVKAVVSALAVKGGPLNQDFHRFFEDEQQLGLTREMQYRRSVGLEVIITSDNRGFLLEDPGFVGNNLVDVDSTRAMRNSTNQTQYGYVNGM